MPALNQLTLLGNLTRDVQLSYTPNNTAVADVGLAVNRKWTNDRGETKEEVCFIDCRAFGKLAENLAKYQTKGNLILFVGYLALEQWEKGGTKHSRHRMIVQNAQFMPAGNGQAHDPPESRESGQDTPM
jgi:single-strand DNA-binding protein